MALKQDLCSAAASCEHILATNRSMHHLRNVSQTQGNFLLSKDKIYETVFFCLKEVRFGELFWVQYNGR